MSLIRRNVFVTATVLLWCVLGLASWQLLDTVEAVCKLQESRSGLWAECFAPVAVVTAALIGVIAMLEIIRVGSVLIPTKLSQE